MLLSPREVTGGQCAEIAGVEGWGVGCMWALNTHMHVQTHMHAHTHTLLTGYIPTGWGKSYKIKIAQMHWKSDTSQYIHYFLRMIYRKQVKKRTHHMLNPQCMASLHASRCSMQFIS